MSIIMLGQEVLAQSGEGAPTWRPVVMGKNGMVAAEHPLQALAGLRVLQSGGNAVDAAVAVFYMTAVTERASRAWAATAFCCLHQESRPRLLINGTRGAPSWRLGVLFRRRLGVCRRWTFLHNHTWLGWRVRPPIEKYGTKDYRSLLADAIEAAPRATPVSAWAPETSLAHERSCRAGTARRKCSCRAAGRRRSATGWFSRPGRTITAIRDHGADVFYRGEIARMTARYHEHAGGLIRYEDLAASRPRKRRRSGSATGVTTSTRRLQFRRHRDADSAHILEGFDLKKLGHNTPHICTC